MNYRMVSTTVGKILIAEALLLLLPLSVAFYFHESDTLWAFLATGLLLLLVGGLLEIKKPRHRRIYAREGFMIVAISWMLISCFGALPFLLSGAIRNPIDAVFETVSGFTTTGSSILTNIEAMPKSLLFWRSFTHWIGGMGILMFVLAFLPQRENQSTYIMRAEVPGPSKGKLVSKTMVTARILYAIYFCMTVVEIILLWAGGIPLFDSVTTAFGTAGTGGFSVRNASIAAYDSVYAEIVISLFMLAFGVNFNLYYLLLVRQFKRVFKSDELRWYLGIVATSTVLITLNILPLYDNLAEALRYAGFQVASIITTTGFSTADYTGWPVLSQMLLLTLFCIGACAGVIFEQHADADPLFENVAQRLFARREVFVASARVRIDAARHADAQPEYFAAVDAAVGDEPFDIRADMFHALRPVEQFERVVGLLFDDVVLQVGDQKGHVVAADVYACEIDRRVGQSEDVGAASARRLHFPEIAHDILLHQFLYQFGDGRYADMQLLGQFREGAFAVDGHVGDNVAFDDVVFMGDSLQGIFFVVIEKLGQ